MDYAATTPVDPHVLKVMLPFFNKSFGNPSSSHRFGQAAQTALENARETIALIMHCTPSEIVFTSCGRESDNLALRGAAFFAQAQRGAKHILISPVEHHAISRTAQQLSSVFGFDLEYLPVGKYGRIHPQDIAARIRPRYCHCFSNLRK